MRDTLAQVMKMFMPLLSPAAGTLRHVLPEGSLLNAGDLIAKCAHATWVQFARQS